MFLTQLRHAGNVTVADKIQRIGPRLEIICVLMGAATAPWTWRRHTRGEMVISLIECITTIPHTLEVALVASTFRARTMRPLE